MYSIPTCKLPPKHRNLVMHDQCFCIASASRRISMSTLQVKVVISPHPCVLRKPAWLTSILLFKIVEVNVHHYVRWDRNRMIKVQIVWVLVWISRTMKWIVRQRNTPYQKKGLFLIHFLSVITIILCELNRTINFSVVMFQTQAWCLLNIRSLKIRSGCFQATLMRDFTFQIALFYS